jgi:hypothetical protein
MFNVDEILGKADLRELVARAGGELVKDRCACPIHGGHDKTGFSVYEKDGRDLWQCFSGDCGGGDAIRFVEVWQGKPFKDACAFLGGQTLLDPVEMERLARERHAKAVAEREAAQAKLDARRRELQAEEKHLYYHEHMTDFFVNEWLKRGLDEQWQGFFSLGACEDFVINEGWHTPTLTIPVYGTDYQVLNIKHRLLNPQNPKDKYRPEKSGLGSFPPLIAFPDKGYDGSVTWVIEGEIKAMVTSTITPDSDWQYIGVPGRNQYKSLTDKLQGKNVIVIPDPGAERDAYLFCKSVNGRWLSLPDKVDDLITAQKYDGQWLKAMEKQARRIR